MILFLLGRLHLENNWFCHPYTIFEYNDMVKDTGYKFSAHDTTGFSSLPHKVIHLDKVSNLPMSSTIVLSALHPLLNSQMPP